MNIAVGLSGGVDSSVVAALLKSQGHNVIGITMKIWDPDLHLHLGTNFNKGGACYGPDESEDIETCEKLAKQLDIPYYAFDLSKIYSNTVVEYFKSEYAAGRTPNPCVKCNSTMKFGFLLSHAKDAGLNFDYFATGHYAKIALIDGKYFICKAKNLVKDQSYFIHRLNQETLSRVMFPLGDMTKEEVRNLARKFNLEVAEKPESQDFIEGGDYSVLFNKGSFLPGNIVDESGNILGKHTGIINYTIGQRKGLGISSKNPLYVKEINAKTNSIIVTSNAGLFTDLIKIEDFHTNRILCDEPLFVKIRKNSDPMEIKSIESIDDSHCNFILNDTVRGVTPGQAAVVYDKNNLIVAYGVING